MPPDAELAAAAAGLDYVSDDEPGIERRRRGRGFSYVRPDGSLIPEALRTWIEALAIPPAWSDVWICTNHNGHLLATGRDDAGRKQYLYHPTWVELRSAAKFDRMVGFGKALRKIRRRTAADLDRSGLPRERVLALVVQLMDQTLIRVGNAAYARRNETFGLTTIRPDHVDIAGDLITFSFETKNSTPVEVDVADRKLAEIVSHCAELGGQELFAYRQNGSTLDVGSADVNDYLREVTRADVTAKDFRTWGASSIVVHHLATAGDTDPYLDAVDAAAEALHNTRAVCRASYIHPELESAWQSGALGDAWAGSRSSRWYDRSESALLKLVSRDGADG